MLTDEQKGYCLRAAFEIKRKATLGIYVPKMTEAELDDRIANATGEQLILMTAFKQRADSRRSELLSMCDKVLARYQ